MATDSIEVAIRVRPMIRREKEAAQKKHWRVTDNTITQMVNGKPLPTSQYTFDHVFDESVVTKHIYDTFAKPKIISALLGFNATIFAYGQTSSGKTHTMMGDRDSPGIIAYVINDIFDYMNEDYTREYLLVVTYMEIYNENITDLLNPSNKNLKIHENSKKEVFVGDITQKVVSGSNQIFALMTEGEKNRHFAETNMNERSSRSHTICQIHIESRERAVSGDESVESEDIGAVRVSQLNLVDLAGSERVSQTGAEGLRLKEGAHINKSLFTLGSVIAKLSEGESFIPFRDSKLTRILQPSLGGNAKTAILCTVTPVSVEETNSTLKFASRAKTIKNCPLVNEVLDDGAMLKTMKKEIRDLKKQLTQMQDNTCFSELQSEKEKYQKQLEDQRDKYELQIQQLTESFFTPVRLNESLTFNTNAGKNKSSKRNPRRETWCPGAMLSKNPLASAAEVAQTVFGMEYDQPLKSIIEEAEEIPIDNKSPDGEWQEVEKLKSENISLRNKLKAIIAERDQFRENLEEAKNDSISVQKQAFTEAQEMIYKHKEEIQMENMELHEKLKDVETKNIELIKERDELKNQLLADTDISNEADLKIESLSLQITDLKIYINELRDEILQQKEDLQKKVDKIDDLETRLNELQKPGGVTSHEDMVHDLKEDINELQIRLKKKTMSYNELVQENQKNNEQSAKELEILKLHIATDTKKYQKVEEQSSALKADTKKYQKVEEELGALKVQFEDLFYKYDELRMISNLNESEMDNLKSENVQLKARVSSGGNNEISVKRRSFKRNEHNVSGDDLHEYDVVTSLNQTLQTKCEELEQITFLYDEREMEIKDVRESLDEYQNKRKDMGDSLDKKSALIEELQSEVECLLKELLEAKSGQSEMDNQVVQLRQIIKEQEAEIIKLGEKVKSVQPSVNESHSQANVEKIETSLQQLNYDLHEVTSARDEILKQNFELQNRLKEREEEYEMEKSEISRQIVQLQSLLNEKEEECEKSSEAFRDEILKQNEEQDVKHKDVKHHKDVKPEILEELQFEVEYLQKELNVEKTGQSEAKNQVVELRQIIREQENEMIKLGEKLKRAHSSRSETGSGTSLDEVKNELNQVTGARDEILKQNDDLQNLLIENEEEFQKEKEEIWKQNIELQNLLAQKQDEFRKEKDNFLDEKEEYELKLEALNDDILKINGEQDEKGDEVVKKETAQIEELQIEVEFLQKELLDGRTNQIETESQVVELRHIIKEQEAEIIKLGEKLKTVQPSNYKSSSQAELEEMRNQLTEVKTARDEILKQKDELQNLLTEKEVELKKELIQEEGENKMVETDIQDDSKLAEMLCSLKGLQNDLQKVTNEKEELVIKNVEMQAAILKKEEDLEKEIKNLQDEKEELTSQWESSRQQNVELNSKLEQVEARFGNLRRVIDDLEEDIFSSESQKVEMEKELEIVRQKFENQDGLKSLKSEIQVFESEKEKLNSEMGTTPKGNQEFEDELESLRKEIQVLQDEKESVKPQLESAQQLNKELNEMMREKLESENGADGLTNGMQTLQNENEELKSQLGLSQQQNEELKSKLVQADARIGNLRRVIDDMEEDMSKEESQKLEIEKELETLRQKFENHDGLEGLRNEFKNLEDENKELKDQIEATLQDIIKFENNLESLSKEIQVIQVEKDDVQSQLESAHRRNEELNDMLLRKLENENGAESLKSEIKMLQTEKEELKSQWESSRQQNEELKSKLEQADARIGNLRRVIDDLEEDMSKEESQKLEIEKELETLRQKLESSSEESRKVLDLQEQLDNALQVMRSLGHNEVEYHSQISHLTQELEDLAKEKEVQQQQSEEHIMAKQAELEDLQDQMMKNRDENQKLRESIHRQRKQVNEMQEALMGKQQVGGHGNMDVLRNEIVELKKMNSELEERLHSLEGVQTRHEELRNTLAVTQAENVNLMNTLEQLQQTLRESNAELDIQKRNYDASEMQVTAYEEQLSTAKAYHLSEIERLKQTIDEQKDQLSEVMKNTVAEQTSNEKLTKALAEIKNLQDLLADSEHEFTRLQEDLLNNTALLEEKFNKLDSAEKKVLSNEVSIEKLLKKIDELKNTVGKQRDELDEVNGKLREFEAARNQNTETLQEALRAKTLELEEQTGKTQEAEQKITKHEVNHAKMYKKMNEFRNIIDVQQDEIDEANSKIQQLIAGGSSNQDDVAKVAHLQEQNKELQEAIQLKSKTSEEQTNKLQDANKKMNTMRENTKRLRNIIDEQQEEIDEAVKNNEQLQNQTKDNEKKLQEALAEVERLNDIVKGSEHDQVETLRIELAGKNMKIQELEYIAFKTEEEMNRLRREVQFGYSKMSKLQEDLRRLRQQADPEDTIPSKRNAPSSSESDVGVVSSVAVYSLRAKLGELEKENQELKDQNKQLEKDKVTMSLFKTDASNQASKLSDEVQFLKKQMKDLSKQNRALKGKEDKPAPQQHVLAPSNPPDEASAAASQQQPSLATRCRASMVKERENRPSYTNWLSPSKTKDMFKDKANQCPHQ